VLGSGTYTRIYEVVGQIPRGRVATYGQVAELAGLPGHARQVGYALHALAGDDVPWHRVVNAQGRVSHRSDPGCDGYQRELLEEEGVEFNDRAQIPLERYRWEPKPSRRRRGKRPVLTD
jgi:methylated-DNA-protein-cysteine methyltransferase-like protein